MIQNIEIEDSESYDSTETAHHRSTEYHRHVILGSDLFDIKRIQAGWFPFSLGTFEAACILFRLIGCHRVEVIFAELKLLVIFIFTELK